MILLLVGVFLVTVTPMLLAVWIAVTYGAGWGLLLVACYVAAVFLLSACAMSSRFDGMVDAGEDR